MNADTIDIAGEPIRTLRDLLRPGLRAVFVGINPAPTSVSAGHYYQGKLGKRFWSRLESASITTDLPPGREDDAAFEQGLGFTDLMKRPTSGSSEVSNTELGDGVDSLARRLEPARGAVVVFVFKRAYDAAAVRLKSDGWVVERMPGPYDARELVASRLAELALKVR